MRQRNGRIQRVFVCLFVSPLCVPLEQFVLVAHHLELLRWCKGLQVVHQLVAVAKALEIFYHKLKVQ